MCILLTIMKKILKVPSYLPTSNFCASFNILQEGIRDSATKTVEKVTVFWNRARIPIRHKQDCIKQVTFRKMERYRKECRKTS